MCSFVVVVVFFYMMMMSGMEWYCGRLGGKGSLRERVYITADDIDSVAAVLFWGR